MNDDVSGFEREEADKSKLHLTDFDFRLLILDLPSEDHYEFDPSLWELQSEAIAECEQGPCVMCGGSVDVQVVMWEPSPPVAVLCHVRHGKVGALCNPVSLCGACLGKRSTGLQLAYRMYKEIGWTVDDVLPLVKEVQDGIARLFKE